MNLLSPFIPLVGGRLRRISIPLVGGHCGSSASILAILSSAELEN
jgi:hypothetical protein